MNSKESVRPPRPEILPRPISRSLAWIIWSGIEQFFNPEIDSQSQINLKAMDEQLEKSSIIVVGYHPSQIEAFIGAVLLRSRLSNLKRIIGPMAAYSYHNPRFRPFIHAASALLSTHLLPVVRKNNPEDANLHQFATEYQARLFDSTIQNLSRPGTIYPVVPGGTRSLTLPSPEKLNTSFVRDKINPTGEIPYVNMAIYQEKEKGPFIHRIGELLHLNQVSPASIGSDPSQIALHQAVWIMNHAATLLPPDRRGSYGFSTPTHNQP